MKESTLTIITTTCFIIGIIIAGLCIHLKHIDYENEFIYIPLAIIMGCSFVFFGTGFILINTEEDSINDTSSQGELNHD